MSKLKKELLNQMIENALLYKQESRRFDSNFFYERLKDFIFKQNLYRLTFTLLMIAFVIIHSILTPKNLVDVNKINDFVTLSIIDDF